MARRDPVRIHQPMRYGREGQIRREGDRWDWVKGKKRREEECEDQEEIRRWQEEVWRICSSRSPAVPRGIRSARCLHLRLRTRRLVWRANRRTRR